jgi:hypothetical protein
MPNSVSYLKQVKDEPTWCVHKWQKLTCIPVNKHGIEFQLFKMDQEKKIPLVRPHRDKGNSRDTSIRRKAKEQHAGTPANPV